MPDTIANLPLVTNLFLLLAFFYISISAEVNFLWDNGIYLTILRDWILNKRGVICIGQGLDFTVTLAER